MNLAALRTLSKKPAWVTEQTVARYRTLADRLILGRLRIAIAIAIPIHLAGNYLDWVIYPESAALFLRIRIMGCAIGLLVAFVSTLKPFERYAVWLVDALTVATAAGVSWMIYLSEGAACDYREGMSVLIVGLLLANGFYGMHNLVCALAVLTLYAAAALAYPGPFDKSDFFVGFFFMFATAAITVLMTKFYGVQHWRAFLHSENLEQSEARLHEANAKLQASLDRADALAKTDDLTKVYNRRHLWHLLGEKLHSARANGQVFYLVIFDIDYFKQINDAYGHGFGDEVLRQVVETVRRRLKPGAFLGRYGGDEFMFVMEEDGQAAILERLTDLARAVKGLPLECYRRPVPVSISVGAVLVDPRRFSDVSAMAQGADEALMHVKVTDRGGIHLA